MASTPNPAKKPLTRSAAATANARPSAKGASLPRKSEAKVAKPKASTSPIADKKPKAEGQARTATQSSKQSVVLPSEPVEHVIARPNAGALKKKDLIDRVLAATGARKKIVKDIVEATLTVLGDALSKGEMLNVPPFGKAKVSRPTDAGTRNAMTVKLRRTTGGGQGKA